MYGPTGVGILYGKEFWLNKLSPFHGGGEMISNVTFEKTTYADLHLGLKLELQIFVEELRLEKP